MTVVVAPGSAGGTPGGAAGGSLTGTYPNPGLSPSAAFGSQGEPTAAGVFNPLHPSYGAAADCKIVTDGVITGNQFSTTQGALTSADVGKAVSAATAGTSTTPFTTTISSVAAGVATLAANAGTNVSAATVAYGTLNTTILQSVIAAAAACAITATGGGTVDLGSAGSFLTGTLTPASNVTIKAEGAALVKHGAGTDGIISNRTSLTAFSNFKVFGVTFVGEGQFAGNITLATGDRRSAIGVYNGSNISVQNCTVSGMAFQGLAFINCTGSLRVKDNTLTNVCSITLGNAIHVGTNATLAGPVNADITGNVVTGCQTACVCVQSSNLNTTAFPYNVSIHDNPNLTTSSFSAIALEIGDSPAGNSTNVTIRQVQIHDNVCVQTSAAGSGTNGISVTDNGGGPFSADPNEFLDVLIHDNVISSTDGGMQVEASYANVHHNNITAGSQGITVAGNTTNTPTGQVVDTNIVRLAPPTYGAQATSAASGTGAVTSLTVTALTQAIPSGTTFTLSTDTNTVRIVFTTTAAAIVGATTLAVTASLSITTTIAAGTIVPTPGHGITAVGVDKPVIKGNTVTYASTVTGGADCIHVSNCTRPSVDWNYLNYAPFNGVQLYTCSDCHTVGNRIYNPNTGGGSAAQGSGLFFNTCSANQRTLVSLNELLDDRGTPLAFTGINRSAGNPRLCIINNQSFGGTYANPVTSDTTPYIVRDNLQFPGSTIAVAGLGSPGSSPYSYQNTNPYPVELVIVGGTVSSITKKRGTGSAENMGVVAGPIHVEMNETIVVTYSVAPTSVYVWALNQA